MAGAYFISNSKIWVGVPERNVVVSVWDGERRGYGTVRSG
jgi:hypothetical protein